MNGTEAAPIPIDSPAARFADVRRYLDLTAQSPEGVLRRLDMRFGVPGRCQGIRFTDLDEVTPAVRTVEDFIAGDQCQCLVLAGPTGVGKTWAMVAGFHEQALQSADGLCVYYSMAALARALLGPERDAALSACLEADLVCIDDVGGGTYVKENGLVETCVEEILCAREGDGLGLILTTNLMLPAFTDVMGDRIADRLRGAWGQWCSLPGQSLRVKRGRRP
jgi:DNA replication protein DnaC